MAIRFITGKPGDGKSMTAVQALQRELMNGKRHIITNLPVFPGRTWAFLKQRFGVEIDTARITILDEDQTKRFFLHRGAGVQAPMPLEKKDGGDGRIDYAQCVRTVNPSPGLVLEERVNGYLNGGVLYIIDEAHLHFGSRQWQDTAQSALFYLSQHRKMGDDVFFVTQHVKQVDSALRRLAAEFWRVTNYGNRFPFGVKLPDYFVIDVFNTEPSLLGQIVDVRKIRLDVEGLASCYDTAAGVGLVGQLADTKQQRKGIPWQVVPVVLLILGVGALFLAKGSGNLFAKEMMKGIPPPTSNSPGVTQTPSPAGPPMVLASSVRPAPVAVPVPPPATFVPPPPLPAPHPPELLANTNGTHLRTVSFGPPVEASRIKWMIRKAGSVSLGLTNGDTFTVGDGRLQVAGQFAILDGTKIFRLPE